MNSFSLTIVACILPLVISARVPKLYALDENFVCIVKTSCLDCLVLSQCSWCPQNNQCFSRKLPQFKDFCQDNYTEYYDHGFSFFDNARCACDAANLEEDCYPPNVTEGPKCTGRGECKCGRCICDTYPDVQHPTKMVAGEYCEYDNFSCDGPQCNEGPYLHNDANNITNSTAIDINKI